MQAAPFESSYKQEGSVQELDVTKRVCEQREKPYRKCDKNYLLH